MARSWSKQETGYLKRYADTKTLAELAERFETEESEVLAKLREVGAQSKDGQPDHGMAVADDPLIGPFEKGLKALYGGKWEQADKQLRKVAEESDQPELAARARQLLRVAERKQNGGGDDGAGAHLRAVMEKNRGDLDAALKIVKAQKKDPDGDFAYLAATVHAVREDEDEAVKALTAAVEANPTHRVQAFLDPDFEEMRQNKDHAHLFGLE